MINIPRHTTRRLLLAAAMLSLFALGCHDTIDEPPLTAPTFGPWYEQKIWAVPGRLEIDSPMVIITRCLPLVEGKGHLIFHGQTGVAGSHWHVLEPVDTVIMTPASWDTLGDIYLPLTFHANVPLNIEWRIQFSNLVEHGFSALFMVDSIYLADGPGMVGINSPEAIAHSPKGFGYQYAEYADPDLTLHP